MCSLYTASAYRLKCWCMNVYKPKDYRMVSLCLRAFLCCYFSKPYLPPEIANPAQTLSIMQLHCLQCWSAWCDSQSDVTLSWQRLQSDTSWAPTPGQRRRDETALRDGSVERRNDIMKPEILLWTDNKHDRHWITTSWASDQWGWLWPSKWFCCFCLCPVTQYVTETPVIVTSGVTAWWIQHIHLPRLYQVKQIHFKNQFFL